jgi:hypothetical protein
MRFWLKKLTDLRKFGIKGSVVEFRQDFFSNILVGGVCR